MTKKFKKLSLPQETINLANTIKVNAHLKHNSEAFKAMNGIFLGGWQIYKIENQRKPKSKKKEYVFFGRLKLEI